MNNKEAALTSCIVGSWSAGFGDRLFEACRLPTPALGISANVRLPETEIAWRELDLITDRFRAAGAWSRLVIELKNGGLGYGSMGQVMFYKHVLAPRHSTRLDASRFIFVVIGSRPNPKRWFGQGVLESDAVEFLKFLSPDYWPDPDVHAYSYDQLGLSWVAEDRTWSWETE